ncbi:fatty acyl-AMP ligase [Streptomyces fenghuangensis]|uniref:fatty acyl-AMP ligase n=1 Tax=Streptomyces sp. ICN903 TaxID=2964654 RepID=UPI001EDA1354|nr:fatty acyl-AMP ligase [Streptomyces sp. ICN903]MCG3039314.1 fatty acyl-AMP ligase [Streptomyces sp. ICN903]
MNGYRSFTDLILTRAGEAPGRAALVLLGESGGPGGEQTAETVSYGELDREARALAGWLQEHGARGERVLVLQSCRRLFAVSLVACLYAGAVAVPVPPAGGRRHHEERVTGIVKDAAVRIALTDSAEAPEVSRLLAGAGYGDVACLPVDTAPAAGPWHRPDLGPDSVAFLQYTSGSTRDPRGVVVTHGNIMANQAAIGRALGTRPGDRLGGWLPFHHDMGLVGQLLHPLWLGGTAVLLSPTAFVKRPVRWLEAISRYGVRVSGAPDFAYELCLRRITDEQLADLDLSGWETAVSGGEPVCDRTLRAFAERFAPAGLRPGALTPCYGLAEATLLVTGAVRGPGEEPARLVVDAAALERHELRAPAPDPEPAAAAGAAHRTLVSCGPVADGELRVVEPVGGEVLPDGRIGEIWLRGPGVARGYWGRPAETALAFDGRTADGDGGHLRTGDLGAVVDGRLYVTGRLKDMIVVAGRNIYPQDLERTVQRVSSLFGAATAFAVPGERDRIVVVQELRARGRYDIDLAALTAAVGNRLTEEFEVRPGGVLLVRPGTVRRTTSGKVERAAMRGLFLRGELRPLHEEILPEVRELMTAGAR